MFCDSCHLQPESTTVLKHGSLKKACSTERICGRILGWAEVSAHRPEAATDIRCCVLLADMRKIIVGNVYKSGPASMQPTDGTSPGQDQISSTLTKAMRNSSCNRKCCMRAKYSCCVRNERYVHDFPQQPLPSTVKLLLNFLRASGLSNRLPLYTFLLFIFVLSRVCFSPRFPFPLPLTQGSKRDARILVDLSCA